MKIRFIKAARDEFDGAIRYYNSERAGLDRIEFWPNAWSRVSPLARLCKTKRFPYGIVYSVEEDEIVVIAVAHLHRQFGYWKKRLKDLEP